MRKMKKALAVALSASMVMGMSMTSFAAEQEVSVDAPIYSYDVTNIVVPTTFVVAFNPDELKVDVKGDGTEVITDQIVSKNYGIINKSTKDKMITVTLNVEDLNEDKITFAADPADVTSASADDYVLSLAVVPADATEVQVGGASADENTTGADLADVSMTKAASADQPLVAGENEVSFLLDKAEYDGTINLSSANGNNVADQFELKGLAAGGKGITAFTFGGTMNKKADWTKLTKGIRITAVYSNENAPDGATADAGTGALYNNPNPVFKAGAGVGTIKYKVGTGNDAVASITKIEMDYSGTLYDGYNALTGKGGWSKASEENGVITLDPAYITIYAGYYKNDATREATITYETVGSGTKTATVNVRLIASVAPSFTTGAGVGAINYTVGTGDEALASITKIEMDYSGTLYDGYNALTGKGGWSQASDANGVVTFDSAFVSTYAATYTEGIREATITYKTVSGATRTATVDVRLK